MEVQAAGQQRSSKTGHAVHRFLKETQRALWVRREVTIFGQAQGGDGLEAIFLQVPADHVSIEFRGPKQRNFQKVEAEFLSIEYFSNFNRNIFEL